MIEDLLDLPWQVSAGFGVAVLIVLKGIVPAIVSGNIYLHPLLAGLSGAAWLFSCAFFLIAAIVFAKEKMTKGKTQAIEPAIGSRAISRKERQEPVYSPSASAKQADQYPPPPPEILDQPRRDDPEKPGGSSEKPAEWSLEVIRDLEWKRFEDVCQQFYEKKGIRSDTTDLGPDGGIDIRLYGNPPGN